MILSGILGSVILGTMARRLKIQEECAKVAFSICCLSVIGLCLTLREPSLLPLLTILSLIGATGLGTFPLILELAVEEAYPANPIYTEAMIHIMGNNISYMKKWST